MVCQCQHTSELQEQVGKHRPGDKATVTYMRNGKESYCTCYSEECAGNTNVVTRGMEGEELSLEHDLNHLDHLTRRDLNVDYGVKVTELNDGKFKDLGIKKGYIILSVNGKKVKTASEVRQATDNETILKSIEGIQTDGTIFSYSVQAIKIW